MFYQKNLSKFTGKHLCQSLIFNQVAGLGSATLLKKRLWHRCFPLIVTCEFCEIFKNTFFTEHFWMTASESIACLLVIQARLLFFSLYKIKISKQHKLVISRYLIMLLHIGLMLTISKVFIFLSILPVWEKGKPW